MHGVISPIKANEATSQYVLIATSGWDIFSLNPPRRVSMHRIDAYARRPLKPCVGSVRSPFQPIRAAEPGILGRLLGGRRVAQRSANLHGGTAAWNTCLLWTYIHVVRYVIPASGGGRAATGRLVTAETDHGLLCPLSFVEAMDVPRTAQHWQPLLNRPVTA